MRLKINDVYYPVKTCAKTFDGCLSIAFTDLSLIESVSVLSGINTVECYADGDTEPRVYSVGEIRSVYTGRYGPTVMLNMR